MRRLSSWSIAGIIAGALLLIGLAIALSIRSTADAAWKAMEERVKVLTAEAKDRPGTRPVLRGTAEPGNAWTDYDQALRDFQAIRSEIHKLQAFLGRASNADRPAILKLVEKDPGILDNVRRGAGRAEGSYPYEWTRGTQDQGPGFYSSYGLSLLARTQARLLLEAGRAEESADLLLVLLQFAGDYRRNSTIIHDVSGLSMMGEALRSLRDLMATGGCSREELAEIARQLGVFDLAWVGPEPASKNEVLSSTIELLGGNPQEFESPTIGDRIRFGFSYRLMAGDAGAKIARSSARFLELDSAPWSACLERRPILREEASEWRNPFALHPVEGSVFSHREKRAQLRLVRMEAHYRATGVVLDLEDPYGGRMLKAESGDKIKFWSVGPNGIDQGGRGTWEIGGSDIVVELAK